MNSGLAILLWALGTAAVQGAPRQSCGGEVRASATAHRLSELPQDVRADLGSLAHFFGDEIADSDAPLLQTDASTAAESSYPTVRFAQAFPVGDKWFVQFEVSLMAGVRTIGYVRQADGHFHRSPVYYFGGPACASIRAALDGVTTPGGF